MRTNNTTQIEVGIERIDIQEDGFAYVFLNRNTDFVPSFSGQMGSYHMLYVTKQNAVFVRF
jgi:hypothetical protein